MSPASSTASTIAQIAQHHHGDPHQTVFFKEQMKVPRQRLNDMAQKIKQQPAKISENLVERQPMPELSPDTSKLDGVDPKQIITIVSGLPRSGTSLMMQILEAAEIACCQDGKRKADGSNTKGYYEHESVMHLLKANPAEKAWVSEVQGQALKVVAPLLSSLPIYDQKQASTTDSESTQQRTELHYRVIFMERPMEQIMNSQSSMLEKLGKSAPKGDQAKNTVSRCVPQKPGYSLATSQR